MFLYTFQPLKRTSQLQQTTLKKKKKKNIYYYFSKKISLDILCESSAVQTIHMEC